MLRRPLRMAPGWPISHEPIVWTGWRMMKSGEIVVGVGGIEINSAAVMEGARDGRSVAELMSYGKTLLKPGDVMEGVPDMLREVQVEATFADGARLAHLT